MENTFYRPERVMTREFDQIIKKLNDDLTELASGKVNETEIISYVTQSVMSAKKIDGNPNMMFWGLDDPNNMPADARVDYFFMPSYIMVGIMVKSLLQIPDINEKVEGFSEVLSAGLLGATARAFAGAGYDTIEGYLDAIEVFIKADITKYLSLFPGICDLFTVTYLNTVIIIREGIDKNDLQNEWGDNYRDRAIALIELMDNSVSC